MEELPKRQTPQEKPLQEKIFSEDMLKKIFIMLSIASTEMDRNYKLRQYARDNSVTPEYLLQAVNAHKVLKIRESEKGELRHFHRTSMNSLEYIIKVGRLLSRSKLKETFPEIQLPGWSSSDNVMMTRDEYSTEGDLVRPGFGENEVVGASGKGAILVLKDSVMQSNMYDTTRRYPSIADASIQEHCEAILVDTEQDKDRVEELLAENYIVIPVLLRSVWKR